MEEHHPSDTELAGWKQIAGYLGIAVPTARKWAKELGLPVVQRGHRYYAFTADLDQWRQRTQKTKIEPPLPASTPLSPRTRRWKGIAIISLAILSLVVWNSRTVSPAGAGLQDELLVVRDEDNRILWTVPFEGIDQSPAQHPPVLRDVDEDGLNEVFLFYEPQRRNAETGRVVCFTPKGKVRWEFELGRPLKIGDEQFGPYYSRKRHEWIDAGDQEFLLVIAFQTLWYPAQVVLLNPRSGKTASEYWHPGYIEDLAVEDIDGDGSLELLLGGVNNPGQGPGRASLVVLDIPFSESRGEENFFGPENAKESHYLLFPPPDIFDLKKPLATIREVSFDTKSRRVLAAVGAYLRSNHHQYLYYYLDTDLNVVDLRTSDTFRIEHNQQTAEGHLDHAFDPSELEPLRTISYFSTAPDANRLEDPPSR